MSRTSASLGIGISALASIGVAAYMTGRRAVPGWSGRVTLPILDAPVEILRDKWGVPSVFAQSSLDAYKVQGWLHGVDRTFQIDLLRRIGTGRLAALVGKAGVGTDRLTRTLGFHQQARGDWNLLDADNRIALEAYSEGVDAAFRRARKRVPVEYRLLGMRPDPWQPTDSLALTRVMALGLCGNWESELARGEIAAKFGVDVLDALDPGEYDKTWPAQLGEEVLGEIMQAVKDVAGSFGAPGGIGSNNWVIGPRRTRSGGAILANDPHLDLGLPSVWYEQRIQGGDLDVRGFTFPGVPGVILGHNGRIAWGFTNSSIDVQDCYIETINEANDEYLDVGGEWKKLEHRTERIEVKGEAPIELDIRSTRRGPIITDAATSSVMNDSVSLRWDSIRPSRSAAAVYSLNRASDWESFRAAIREWVVPAQNVVYADTEGNIGFQHMGEVPIRAEGNDGSVPRRGDDPAGEWEGTIPWEKQPSSFNPPTGRIVTANDRLVDDNYPYFLSREWMNGYRGQRIRELIDQTDGHTVGDQIRIQTDTYSIPGMHLRALLLERDIQPQTHAGRELFNALINWDGTLRSSDDSSTAWRLLQRAMQDQVFGFLGELMPRFLGYSRTGVNGFWALFGKSTPIILDAIENNDTSLLELGERVSSGSTAVGRELPPPLQGWVSSGSWQQLLTRSLDQAGKWWEANSFDTKRESSRALTGKNRSQLHRMRLQHPLGVIPGISKVANRGPYVVPGDPDTVWQMSQYNNPSNAYAMVGPSHRHVIDLGDVDKSVAVLCGGQSGHPASPHYADQIGMWRRGEVRSAPFSRPALEAITRFRQLVEP